MEFEIVIHSQYKIATRYGNNAKDIKEKIYDFLIKYGIDEETVIDCDSWCELATDGESYNTDEFDVYVSAE